MQRVSACLRCLALILIVACGENVPPEDDRLDSGLSPDGGSTAAHDADNADADADNTDADADADAEPDAGDTLDAGAIGAPDAGDGDYPDAGMETDPGAPDGGPAPALPACPIFGNGTQRITKWLFAKELSGIAESRRNPGIFWIHNDSGGKAEVFAMASSGQRAATLVFNLPNNARALDWEDIAVGPGPQPGISYIYVGDVGSNAVSRSTVVVYRALEPEVAAPSGPFALPATLNVSGVEAFTFQYPGGIRNAETLMVDPVNGDAYIVEKDGGGDSKVFRAAAPLSSSGVTTLQEIAQLRFGRAPLAGSALATAGDISPDGREVVIRTYDAAFLWRRAPGETIADALATDPCPIPLVAQNQGEALGFSLDGRGYYSASENSDAIYYYPRR
jgi:hypothetical protein